MSLVAGHAPRPFYPRCSATRGLTSPSRLRRNNRFRRRSWDFALRSLVPGHEVSQRFRCSFPTCRWVGFHLDLFLSRDRPSDIICRGRFRHCPFEQRPGSAFTHIHTKNGRSRKSTSASGFRSRAQSVSRHHQRCGGAILPWVLPLPGVRTPPWVRPRDLEISPGPPASGRPAKVLRSAHGFAVNCR